MANYWDLYWVLDDEQQQLLLRLAPALRRRPGTWGWLWPAYAIDGDIGGRAAYADSARVAFEQQLTATPEDAPAHILLGLALAYMGRKDEAIREGERGVALLPISERRARPVRISSTSSSGSTSWRASRRRRWTGSSRC